MTPGVCIEGIKFVDFPEEMALLKAADVISNDIGCGGVFMDGFMWGYRGRWTDESLPTYMFPMTFREIRAGTVRGPDQGGAAMISDRTLIAASQRG